MVAAALAGCSGDAPTLGGLTAGGETVAALQQTGATADVPAYNPFGETPATASARRREVIENPSIAEIMQAGPLPEKVLRPQGAPRRTLPCACAAVPHCPPFPREA